MDRELQIWFQLLVEFNGLLVKFIAMKEDNLLDEVEGDTSNMLELEYLVVDRVRVQELIKHQSSHLLSFDDLQQTRLLSRLQVLRNNHLLGVVDAL